VKYFAKLYLLYLIFLNLKKFEKMHLNDGTIAIGAAPALAAAHIQVGILYRRK
jgi:hypothetical protein